MFRLTVVNGRRTIVNDLLTMIIMYNMTDWSRRRRVACDSTTKEGTAKADGLAIRQCIKWENRESGWAAWQSIKWENLPAGRKSGQQNVPSM